MGHCLSEDEMGLHEEGKKKEDHWFLEKDLAALERIRKEREERIRRETTAEQAKALEALRAAHWLRCPKCGHAMEELSLSDVSVERCTRCDGIFFDRGELEDFLSRKFEERKSILRRVLGL
jgi:uncharacterized protein